jgi:triphosphoribosyl-dephospho-CoA synthase
VAPEHDVSGEALATPLEVMAAAAYRDQIARQYADGFRDLFERALPLLVGFETRWRDPAWAAAGLYLDFLARYPDSHVARKWGLDQAVAVARRAAPLAAALAEAARPQVCTAALRALDRDLKTAGINPGTSADLTVACLLIRALEPLCCDDLSAADVRRIPGTGPTDTGAFTLRNPKPLRSVCDGSD